MNAVNVLVTGGTGLVGSQLIEALLEKGHPPDTIRALVRPRSPIDFLKERGVRLCTGDLLDVDSLKAATDGVDIVYHCAGAVDEKRREVFWEVNVIGTERMLEAARWAGVPRFVYVSSIGVYGLLETTPATEDHPTRPLRPYAVSKLAAEQRVRTYAQRYGLSSVILRPTAIVGRRDRTITKRLVRLVRRRIVPMVGGGRARVSFVHARDVAEAMILAGQSQRAAGNVYNVEGFSAPLREVVQFFIDEVGSGATIIDVPYGLAFVGALIIDGVYAVARRHVHPIRARMGLRQLTRDLIFDTTKIRMDLGFQPRYGMEESFRQAIRWQLQHGG